MRRAADQLIELIHFAGVAVAFVGVVVTVVRAAMASLAGGRSTRITDIGLDLAHTVLVALDLLLVGAILEVAVAVNDVTLTRLATIAGLRVGLTLLIAFEEAYRTDSRKPKAVVSGAQPGENLWADRARLGRERRRTAG